MELNTFAFMASKTVTYYPLQLYIYFLGREGQSVSPESFKKNYKQHEHVTLKLVKAVEENKNISKLKKKCLFHKAEVPKVFVGQWKKFDSDDDSEGEGTISENGVVTTDSDGKDILIAKPLKEYLVDQSGSIDNDKVQKEFAKIQKSLKSHGFQAKSVNDIYHDASKSYYYVLVDGGKRIVILEDSYGDLYSGYIERQDKD